MDRGAEVTVLNLKDMSRCHSCRRLVTLRRILSLGSCKCGARRLDPATYLDSNDLLEIEEDYGWHVKITGVTANNVSPRLLSTGKCTGTSAGSTTVEVDEARLHSGAARGARAASERRHAGLAVERFIEGFSLPWKWARDPRKFRDYLDGLRKPRVSFSGGQDERG